MRIYIGVFFTGIDKRFSVHDIILHIVIVETSISGLPRFNQPNQTFVGFTDSFNLSRYLTPYKYVTLWYVVTLVYLMLLNLLRMFEPQVCIFWLMYTMVNIFLYVLIKNNLQSYGDIRVTLPSSLTLSYSH